MKNICIIVAHIDDDILSMGGTLFRLKEKNIITIYTSKSDYTDFNGKWHRTQKQTKSEMIDALSTIGIHKKPYILNYPTKKVPYNSSIIERLDKIFHKHHIDTIITHPPSDTHFDHNNTSKSAITAARRINNIFTFEPIFPANSISLFQPNVYINISGKAYKRKILALQQYKSQYKKYGQTWIDSVDSLSRIRGIEIGVKRAECFCCIKQEVIL